MRQQLLGLARHQQRSAGARVVQAAHAERIARPEQPAGCGVPQDEGEITGQPIDKRLAPAVIGRQQQRRLAGWRFRLPAQLR